MTRTGYLALLAAVTFATCSRPTPEQQIVNDAAAALGGAERILAVKTIVMEGEGTQYNLGQDVVPNASGQTFTVTEYKRSIDVPAGRARTELTRQPNFTFFQGPAAQRQVQGIDGAVGYNVAPNGTANRIPDPAVSDRRAELLHACNVIAQVVARHLTSISPLYVGVTVALLPQLWMIAPCWPLESTTSNPCGQTRAASS